MHVGARFTPNRWGKSGPWQQFLTWFQFQKYQHYAYSVCIYWSRNAYTSCYSIDFVVSFCLWSWPSPCVRGVRKIPSQITYPSRWPSPCVRGVRKIPLQITHPSRWPSPCVRGVRKIPSQITHPSRWPSPCVRGVRKIPSQITHPSRWPSPCVRGVRKIPS